MALIMDDEPTSPRSAAPAERAAAWLPAALDERLRLALATGFVALSAVTALAVLITGDPSPRRAGGTVVLALVAASVWINCRRRRRPLLVDPLEAGLLFAAGLLLGDHHELEIVFLVALVSAAVHRRGAGRVVVTASFTLSLLGLALVSGETTVDALTTHLPGMLLASCLPMLIADMVRMAERAVRREQILAAVGRALTAEQHDVDGVGRLVADAAHELVRSADVAGSFVTSLFVGERVMRRTATTGTLDRPFVETFDPDLLGSIEATDTTTRVIGDRSVMTALFTGEDIDETARAHGLPGTGVEFVLVVPLYARGALRGAIVVLLDEVPDAALRDALENLGDDTVLALDAISSLSTAASRERYVQRILDHSTDAIAVLDADFGLLFDSGGSRLLGWPSEELQNGGLGRLPHVDDAVPLARTLERVTAEPGVPVMCEWRALHRDGHWVHLESVVTNLLDDDDVGGYLLSTRDVSERKALEDHIAHQSLHDPVTDLSNRALFVDRVAHALERSKRSAQVPAVCFLDVDGFKQVNETYGHDVGDQLLRVIADRLRSTLREGDTAARFGGDEFGVLMEDVVDNQVAGVVSRLHEALCAPVVIEGRTLLVKVTIGVATPHAAWSSRELLQAVDAALLVAKRESRGSWRRYDDTLPRPGEQDDLLADLERAVDAGQLRLQYQPVVNLRSGTITAVEALVRWHHPEKGLVPPNAFIPLAERSGLIIPIGQWVLETAIRQLRYWHEAFPDGEPLAVHVNVSAVQLADAAAVDAISAVIERSDIAARHITLEITESALVADPLAVGLQLARLKGLGVRLAIDDFGVGYAGIGYLREFDVDQLKIDKSFVDTLEGHADTDLFEAMLGFSQAFKLDTVAEGVEHAGQAEILIRLGCASAQGYLFARPLDPLDLEGMLTRTVPGAGEPVALGSSHQE